MLRFVGGKPVQVHHDVLEAGDRPATYEEYLVSIGLSVNTVRNYVWRLNKAERIRAGMGATLLTADAFELAALAAQVSDTHSLRGQLRCSLKHYYEWMDRMDAPLRARESAATASNGE